MKTTVILLSTLFCSAHLFSMKPIWNNAQKTITYIANNEEKNWKSVKNFIEKRIVTVQDKICIINYFGPHSNHYYNLFLLWHKDIDSVSFFTDHKNENFFNELVNYLGGGSNGNWDFRCLTKDFCDSYKTLYALIIKEYAQCININAKPSVNYNNKMLLQTPPMKLFSDIQSTALSKDCYDISENKNQKELLENLIKIFNKKIDLTIKNEDNETILDLCSIKDNDVPEKIENKIFLRLLLNKHVRDQPKLSPKLNNCFFYYVNKEYL